MSEYSTEAFTTAYIDCAIWASTDDNGEDNPPPMDREHGPDDLADETLRCMTAECEEFCRVNESDLNAIDRTWADAGHDFWLTRNHHGAGFWDRYYGDDAELRAAYMRLDAAAKAWGECYLYVGDDGKIYI